MRSALIAAAALLAAGASAADWHDAPGSTLAFEARFEGDYLPGTFGRFDVAIAFDPDAPETGTLTVTVDVSTADMGDPDMNDMLFDPAWLDARQHSEATFTSRAIEAASPSGYAATGTLDLKGVQREIVVPFSWEQDGDTAKMRGKLVLQRTDFEIGSGEWASGDSIDVDVTVQFDVNLATADPSE